jgi:hypothetical protein
MLECCRQSLHGDPAAFFSRYAHPEPLLLKVVM